MKTGLKDRNGVEISDGDLVSLDGNMTADDSLGLLPNGWIFDETDVYEVYMDERIGKWSLRLGVEPDSAENCKYMNHAVSLLHQKGVTIVPPEVARIMLRVGDLVTREGTDVHKVVYLESDGFAGKFECVKAPASGWIAVGESEYNLARRYSRI